MRFTLTSNLAASCTIAPSDPERPCSQSSNSKALASSAIALAMLVPTRITARSTALIYHHPTLFSHLYRKYWSRGSSLPGNHVLDPFLICCALTLSRSPLLKHSNELHHRSSSVGPYGCANRRLFWVETTLVMSKGSASVMLSASFLETRRSINGGSGARNEATERTGRNDRTGCVNRPDFSTRVCRPVRASV